MNIKVRPNKNALTRGYINCTQKSSNIVKTKEEKGITLIALLVTVILLVILVGVAVSQITGDEGIIVGTEEAVDDYKYQQYKEQIEQLVHSIILADSLAGRTTTVTSMAADMENESWIKSAVPNEESKDIIVTVQEGYVYQVYYDELTGMSSVDNVGTEDGASLPTVTATYNKETYTIEVTASCEDGITKIELIYGGEVVQTANSETASFEVEESGWYQVKATSGKGKTRYANVRVSNEVGVPSIAITSTGESENDWYGKDNVPVEVTISTEEGNVSGIYYKKNTDTDYTYVEGKSTLVTINTSGRTVIYAYAVDGRGNESDIVRIEVKYDNVVPQVGAVAVSPEVPASGWYNTDVVVSIPNAEDANSGIAGYYYWEVVGDVAEVPDEEKTYVSGASKTLTVKSEGIKVLAFQAIDKAGNKSGISNITVQKDSTNPRSFTISISNQTKTEFTINAGTTDNTVYTNSVSGMDYYEIYVNGNLEQTIDITDEANTGMSYTKSELTENATYTVYVVACDKAGNKTESATMTIIAQDVNTGGGGTQEPEKQLLSPTISLSGASQTNGYYTGNVIVTIEDSASEEITKATNIRYKVEGTNAISETDVEGRTATFTITQDGSSTVTAWVEDSEGNLSTASTQTVIKDTTAPELASLTATGYDKTAIAVNASGTDSTSGIASYEFQYSSTSAISGFSTASTISTSNTDTTYTYGGLTPNTRYYLRVIVTDVAGNGKTSEVITQNTADAGIPVEDLKEEIGKYVDYIPVGGSFTSQGQYNGGGNQNFSTIDTLKWRILFVDDNKLTLIANTTAHENFSLGGPGGYSNGVLLLNETCKALYSNTALGAEGRSLNIDDIEVVSSYDKTNYKEYDMKYGAEFETHPNYDSYPEICMDEKTVAVTRGVYGTLYDVSEQDKYYSSYWLSATSGKVKWTTYTYSMSTAYLDPVYLELFRYKEGTTTDLDNVYWIASRCVSVNNNSSYRQAYFSLFCINKGTIASSCLMISDTDEDTWRWTYSYALRPVVEIDLSKASVGATGSGTAGDPYSITAK